MSGSVRDEYIVPGLTPLTFTLRLSEKEMTQEEDRFLQFLTKIPFTEKKGTDEAFARGMIEMV